MGALEGTEVPLLLGVIIFLVLVEEMDSPQQPLAAAVAAVGGPTILDKPAVLAAL